MTLFICYLFGFLTPFAIVFFVDAFPHRRRASPKPVPRSPCPTCRHSTPDAGDGLRVLWWCGVDGEDVAVWGVCECSRYSRIEKECLGK